MKALTKIIVFLLILIAAVGGTFYFAKTKYETVRVEETKEENIITETKVEITGETIREGLMDIGELATEEYYFTRVETYDSSKNFKGFKVPFTQSKFVYSYDGVVKAGIDFANITVVKDDLAKVITVTLPKSDILDCNIDTDTFKLYDEKNSVFNKFSVTDFNNTLDKMLDEAKADAIDKGVLERADENAKMIIKNFLLSTYTVDDYYIDVKTKVE